MAKKKVWELAREISVPLGDLMQVLPELGIRKKDHLEQLLEEEEEQVRGYFQDRSRGVTERKVVSRNVVRRRSRRVVASEAEAEPAPGAVPESVSTDLVVEMPEPEPEPPMVEEPEAEAEVEASAEAAAPAAPEVAAEAPESEAPAAPEAAPRPAPVAKPAEAKPVAAKPAEAKPEAAKPGMDAAAAGKKKKGKGRAVDDEEEQRTKRPGARQKRGRRILVERKRTTNLRQALYDRDGGDDVAAKMPEVAERSSGRRERRAASRAAGGPQPMKEQKRIVRIEESITAGDLAHEMSVKANVVLKKLMEMGIMTSINALLDLDTASLLAEEFDYKIERVKLTEEKYTVEIEDDEESLQGRPPVVTIMGHVDHGKTSLLDRIQQTDLAAQEAGGITQAVGAYRVDVPKGTLVFLDTPGHEAFTAMRARGAKVTDLVILVVAADDGVQPQTVEAINHARAAEVPIVVAVNKIDKDNAEPDRVRRELSEHGLLCEDWGGDTVFMDVSAKQAVGIDALLDMVLLQSEMLELTANPEPLASGYVIESRLDRKVGNTCTVLVHRGTLSVGDIVVSGMAYGKVRRMVDEHEKPLREVRPSFFAEITGLNGQPDAGDPFFAVESEKDARVIVDRRDAELKQIQNKKLSRVSLEDLFAGISAGEVEELRVILKADVQGSVEAVRGSLDKIESKKVGLKIIHAAVGGIGQSDIQLAAASDAVIVGFNVRADATARQLASDEGVEIKLYSVIYHLLDDVRAAMEGLLAPRVEERVIGQVEIRATFTIPKIGTIAGCYVQNGKVGRNNKVIIYRNDIKLIEGKISSLKRHKDDAREVAQGYECGIGIENYNDLKVGDIFEVIEESEVKDTLD